MTQKNIYFFIKSLSIIGIILALYLLWEQVFQPSFQPCSINATGAVSKTLGIPTPLYGLIGYIVIFISAILKKKKLLFSMATFGLLFCLWIGYREIFELHVICPVCIACQTIILTIFSLSTYLMLRKDKKTEK